MMTLTNIEEWRPVVGYEGLYEVSNLGKVASLNYNGTGNRKELKPIKTHHGYLNVRLYKGGTWRGVRVHRIVANAFVPNPDNLQEINHKDENPANNVASNLEWCSHKYNCNYGSRIERQRNSMTNGKLSKAIVSILPDGTIEEYPSMAEASRQLNCSQGRISDCCLGKIKTYHHGRRWAFKNDGVI